jgi:hypothetical protein
MKLLNELKKHYISINEVDRVSDKEAGMKFADLEDRDLDNDGDSDETDKYLHKRLGTVAKMDEEEEEEELEEMSATASVPGYMTPKAFGDADDDIVTQGGMKKVKESKSAFMRMMSEMYGIKSINEAVSYRDYKRDESATPSQKVNQSIKEVNSMLAEMEKIVANNLRLKQEAGVHSSQFWKSTSQRFAKINERMVRISNRLKELSK